MEGLTGARALGPIFQGLAHAANGVSQGSSVEDIVDVIAATAVQSAALAHP